MLFRKIGSGFSCAVNPVANIGVSSPIGCAFACMSKPGCAIYGLHRTENGSQECYLTGLGNALNVTGIPDIDWYSQ